MRRPLPFLALLLLATLAVYAPGLDAPPAYDDARGILFNPRLKDPAALLRYVADASPRILHGMPLPPYAYRPFTEATLALGSSIPGLRLGNLLIHGCAVVLAFLVVRRLAGEGPARWASAFLALHPLAVQSVTYVYQRSSSLAAALGFLCLLLFLSGRTRWALAAGILAAMSKESAACLPLSLAALAWISRRDGGGRRALLLRWLPFLALPALVAYQGWRTLSADLLTAGAPLADLSGPQYLLVQIPVVAGYLALNALPFPLHVVYPRPALPFHPPPLATLLCGALLLGLSAWILLGSRRFRIPRLALALMLAPLALESSVFPILDVAANQRCYPGLLGSALLFGWGVARLPSRRWGLAVLLPLAALTAFQGSLWAEAGGQERQDVRHAPRVMMTWGTYARVAMDLGRPERAEPLFRQGLRLPGFLILVRRGRIDALRALGRREEARREEDALLGRSDSALALWAAVQAAEEGKDEARLEALAVRFETGGMVFPDLALWLARRRGDQGRWARAEEVLRRHLRMYPSHPILWDHLGRILLSQDRHADARTAYETALALDPALAKAWLNLGMARLGLGDRAGARAAFRKALEVQPGYERARRNLEAMGP